MQLLVLAQRGAMPSAANATGWPVSASYTNGAALAGAPWFDQNWMFLGLPLVSVVSVVYARLWRERILSRRFFHWTLAIWYLLHQWEEHAWDVMGNRYSFIEWFNAFGHGVAGEPNDGSIPGLVTVRLITIINVPVVWVMFPAGALVADRYSDIPALVLWAIATFNAFIAHVLFGLALTAGVYNPGMLQSVFMTCAGLYYLFVLRKLHRRRKLALACLVIGGPIFHVVLLALPAVIIRSVGLSSGAAAKATAEWVFLVFECVLSALLLFGVAKIFHTADDISPPAGSPLQLRMAGAASGGGGGAQLEGTSTTAGQELEPAHPHEVIDIKP